MPAPPPHDRPENWIPPASPLVEATLCLVHEMLREKARQSGLALDAFLATEADRLIAKEDFADAERRILASGYRFTWSAVISANERPDAYKRAAEGEPVESGFSHPNAPQGDFDSSGRALRGVGDNVVQHRADVVGVARYIRTNERVLSYLTNGVPPRTIAIIDDSGGTLTAPIIEKFAGVICAGGTVRSHLGILTREYNIPCLMNAKIAGIADGDQVMIESSGAAKTTEDYQHGVERTARVWLLAPTAEG